MRTSRSQRVASQKLVLLLRVGASACVTFHTVSLAQTKDQGPAAAPSPLPVNNPSTDAGEIIVTAQKREESINSVPMSISAFTAATLAQRGITTTADLDKAVPGLTVTPSPYNGSSPIYTLRGVGYYEYSLAAQPTVTVYTDEIPLPFQVMTAGSMLDIERVEVLKGPQGLLFGQNSTGGAIDIIAAKPTDHFSAGTSATLSRFDQVSLDGFVSGPLTSNLKARVAVSTTQGGDWQYSYTRDQRLGWARRFNGRLLLDWTPTDRLKVSLNVIGGTDKSDTQAGQLIAINPTNAAGESPSLAGTPLAPNNDRAANWSESDPMRLRNTFFQFAGRLDYELSDTVKLTSLASYSHLKYDSWNDTDGTQLRILDLHDTGSIKVFNQELRVAGHSGPFSWIVGGNYSHATIPEVLDFFIGDLSSANFGALGTLIDSPTRADQRMQGYAGFANAEIKVARRLTFTAGLRYTKDDRSLNSCNFSATPVESAVFEYLEGALNPTLPIKPIELGQCTTFDHNFRPTDVSLSLKQNNVSWRGALDYKSDRGTLLYASISRGYKAGSFATIGSTSIDQLAPVRQEQLTAYEVGVKAPFANRRVHLDASVFYYDYRDKQLRGQFLDPVFGVLSALVNIPKSYVYGIDAALSVRPIEGLTLSAAGTYVKTRVQNYVGINQSGGSQNFSGKEFPDTPKFTGVLEVDYKRAITRDLSAIIGGSVVYHSTSDATFDPHADGSDPSDSYIIKGYALVDLRAGLMSTPGGWKIEVWGKNIFNKFYTTNVFNSIDTVTRFAGHPAWYGVTLSWRM